MSWPSWSPAVPSPLDVSSAGAPGVPVAWPAFAPASATEPTFARAHSQAQRATRTRAPEAPAAGAGRHARAPSRPSGRAERVRRVRTTTRDFTIESSLLRRSRRSGCEGRAEITENGEGPGGTCRYLLAASFRARLERRPLYSTQMQRPILIYYRSGPGWAGAPSTTGRAGALSCLCGGSSSCA